MHTRLSLSFYSRKTDYPTSSAIDLHTEHIRFRLLPLKVVPLTCNAETLLIYIAISKRNAKMDSVVFFSNSRFSRETFALIVITIYQPLFSMRYHKGRRQWQSQISLNYLILTS